ncbi:MAG: germination protein YpeB [Clostridia bacterium]|nr:germination protein YpeB [Clostridia bacterium]
MENEASLEYMYQTNNAVLSELQTLRDGMSEKDWAKLMKGSQGGMAQESMQNVNSNVIQTPSSIQDGPFAENKEKVTAKGLTDGEEVTPTKAEELLREYFSDYDVQTVEYQGETVAEHSTMYNFNMTDSRGREAFAQISKAGGKLVMFNSYEPCYAKNFSQEKCVEIAREFLKKLGFENMTPVWLQENGTTANVNFVYEQDGALCYADMAIVKVCETRGRAIGLEALPYYLNHETRAITPPALTEEQAAKALGKLQPQTGRLALIPYEGEEGLTYEFSGMYGENEFFAYIDANTGEETQTYTVINTKQGRLLQ